MSHNNNGAIAAAFIAGTAIGVLTALLVAPKSGPDLREEIVDNLNNSKDLISQKVSSGTDIAKSKIGEVVATTKSVASESKRAAKEAMQRVKDNKQTDNEQELEA